MPLLFYGPHFPPLKEGENNFMSEKKKKKLLMFSIMHTNQYEGVDWMDYVVSPITLVEIGS